MSTVYAGTSYEYVTQATLRDYGFELYRVGGRGDRGVDLIGIWRVPGSSAGKRQAMGKEKEQENDISPQQLGSESSSRGPPRYETPAFAFKVLVQCKRLVGKHAKIGPHLIRELDGTVRAARITPLFDAVFPHNGPNTDTYTASAREKQNESPEADADADADGDIDTHIVPYKTPEHQHHSPSHGASHLAAAAAGGTGTAGPTIGVLVSTKPATKGVVDSMRRSSRGLVWIMMEQVRATPEIGLEGGDPTLCRSKTQSAEQQEDDSSSSEPESEAPSPPSPPDFSSRGRVKQILWNQAARDLGLEGVDVVKRYDGEGDEEVVLMRGGRVWCPS
ncbi:hypothetical protein A1O7_00230 [Cladophialophora yegresii CBS 114405]|uniref:Uncharacterized protein n=1 Tax=Cladophialophora yegresii CBS 114405 TaxID=1182544 RepID=W9WFY4_9EURO|nr:uncharacterized protein A1O7_00230 [Cladophialophora yegresii CBS 114405]EXJ63895.1 hypothetical protein A1O7_00230 [Cladophialophora yegresii CBS 114405]